MASTAPASTHHERPPLYRDVTVVKWVVQIIALLLTLGALWFLANQAGDNLKASNVPTDYDFLSVNPGIDLSSGIDTDPDTGGRALWVGMVNTLRMAIAGILVATVIGVLIGLSRLSNNWLLKKLGTVFVETLRNVPLLVQILFYGAVFASLDRVSLDVGPVNGWFHVSNKGLSMPRVHIADGFYQWMIVIGIGLFAANLLRKRRIAQQDLSGEETYPILSAFGLVVIFGALGWFIHPIFGFVGNIFDGLSSVVSAVPEGALQILVALLSVGTSVYWIRGFLNSRRTPAGLAKLTDDDYFRMIFAGVGGVLGAVFFLVLWPGLSSWMINSGSDLFEVLGNKFGNGRSGRPVDVALPDIVQVGKFPNYGPSGLNFSIGFAAVFFGVVFYTSAFIAEIVRGGILAVPKGQTDDAAALGLRRSTALRRVIIPQAARVMLPPLGNQYLNLTKNTSLAIAVGYSDIVQVGQTVYNQTGKTLPVVSIWMFFYLSCSLSISVIVNFFNVRMRIVER